MAAKAQPIFDFDDFPSTDGTVDLDSFLGGDEELADAINNPADPDDHLTFPHERRRALMPSDAADELSRLEDILESLVETDMAKTPDIDMPPPDMITRMYQMF